MKRVTPTGIIKLIQQRKSLGLPFIGKAVIRHKAHKLTRYLERRARRLPEQCETCERSANRDWTTTLWDELRERADVHYFCSGECLEENDDVDSCFTCFGCGVAMLNHQCIACNSLFNSDCYCRPCARQALTNRGNRVKWILQGMDVMSAEESLGS